MTQKPYGQPTREAPNPLLSLLGIFFHGAMLFIVPFVVGGVGGMFLEVSEVVETGSTLVALSFLFIAPMFIAQMLGVVAKTWREVAFLKRRGEVTARRVLDAAHQNVRILTARGYFVLVSGVIFVLLALGLHWASLGVVAVASLTLFYMVTGTAVFLSAFMVRTFEAGMGRRRAGIRREYHPSVGRTGQAIEERFLLERVPILPGFYLLIQDDLPERLMTEIRHVVPPRAASKQLTLSSWIRRTPRGQYHTGPARVWYVDMVGMTRVNVASLATGTLKIMPTVRSVEIIEPPRTNIVEPDILTKPNKFPTEDFFRFREYLPGDDTRRLHWKISMRVGQLQVRIPESREISANRVMLALDTWVPPDWLKHTAIIDDLLDALVDVWISTAHRLKEQGEHVTLIATLPDEEGVLRREVIDCNRVDRSKWLDAGARARWQSEEDVLGLFSGDDSLDDLEFMVVLTSRLSAPPPDPLPGRQTTWIYLHPGDTMGPEPPSLSDLWFDFRDEGEQTAAQRLLRVLRLPYPAGSEENALAYRVRHFRRRMKAREDRLFIRRKVKQHGDGAFAAMLARPDVVYRMQVLANHYRLVGVSAGDGGPPREVPPPPPPAHLGQPQGGRTDVG